MTPPTTSYTITRGIRVPMRDGVDLVADHYAPTGRAPVGTLLVRGPYGRALPYSLLFARVYAARGYHVVLQSVRGTFGSAGEFEPMRHEVTDGNDTVACLREQPWFTGRFGTIGLSYLGFTQWAMLTDPPPELAAAVITVGPHDFSAASWGTGAFSLNDFLGWSNFIAHQEEGGKVRALGRMVGDRRRMARATTALPMGQAGRALLGPAAPWYESWLKHPDRDDPFWSPFRFDDALDRIDVPVLLITGWQDLFVEQTLEQYRRLHRRGVDVALTVGPWTHTQIMAAGAGPAARDSLQWLDAHIAGTPPVRRKPVRAFVTGDGWVELPEWPPPVTEHVLYLQPRGGLAENSPPASGGAANFTYDPSNPTPTIGGRLLSPEGGYRNDGRLARRADVLSFTADPLAAELYIVGTPVVELSHSADNPHADVFVRVSEVDRKGRSRNVSDGYRRITATAEPGCVRIELDAIAHRFCAGSRIRVLVAGGSHPRFSRNPGTGDPPLTAQRLATATHSVHHGRSRVMLPVSASRPGE